MLRCVGGWVAVWGKVPVGERGWVCVVCVGIHTPLEVHLGGGDKMVVVCVCSVLVLCLV